MNEPILQVKCLKKSYNRKSGSPAVSGVTLNLHEGEILGIVGESGCGKSTLARCVIRLLRPDSGEILWRGRDISRLDERGLRDVRPQIQMIFQNPYASFNPRFCVGSALERVGKLHNLTKDEYSKRLNELLLSCEIDKELLKRRPRELSGGQLQRLAIVRALLPEPRLLIADEAVSALDVSVQESILRLLSRLRQQYKIAVLFISHDLAVVKALCSRVLVMYRGTVVEEGDTAEIFTRPAHPYTRALLSARPKLHPEPTSERILLSGDVHDDRLKNSENGCLFADRCYLQKCQKCLEKRPDSQKISENHRVACYLKKEGEDEKK